MKTKQNKTKQSKLLFTFIFMIAVQFAFAQPNYFQYGGLINTLNNYQSKTAPQMFYSNFSPNGDNACFILKAEDPGLVYQGLNYAQTTLLCPTFQNGNYRINSAHTFVTGDVFSTPIGVVENNQVAYVLSEIHYLPPTFIFPFEYHLTAIDLNTMMVIESKGIEIPGKINAASIAFDDVHNEVIVVFSIDGNAPGNHITDLPGLEIIRFDPSSLSIIDYARLTEDLNFFYNPAGLSRYHIEDFKLTDISLNYNGALGSTTIGITGNYNHQDIAGNIINLSFFVGIDLMTFNIVGDFWEYDFSSIQPDKYQRITYDEGNPGSELYFYTVNTGVNQERVIFGQIDLFASNQFSRFVRTPLGDPYYASSLKYNIYNSRVELIGEAFSSSGEKYNKFAILDPFNPITTFFDLDLGDGVDEEAVDYLYNPNNNEYAVLSKNLGINLPKLQDLSVGCFGVSNYNFTQSNTAPFETTVDFDIHIPGFSHLHDGFTNHTQIPQRFDCNQGSITPAEVGTSTKENFTLHNISHEKLQFIDLYDITGKLLDEKIQIQSTPIQANITHLNLSAGIYLIKLHNGKGADAKFEKIFLSN